MQKTFSLELAGRTITVETGKYAEQAGGAILIRCGYTALLVCATVAKQPRDGADFLPLSCDYEEKMYAAGKIPGGFIKREGRPSEKAILTSRLIDRQNQYSRPSLVERAVCFISEVGRWGGQ